MSGGAHLDSASAQLQTACEGLMQQALAQMHALTCNTQQEAASEQKKPQQTAPQRKKGASGGAAASASARGSSQQSATDPSAVDPRATKAALEGLYGLLAALQSVMSSDAYLKVGACLTNWNYVYFQACSA